MPYSRLLEMDTESRVSPARADLPAGKSFKAKHLDELSCLFFWVA